MNAIQKCNHFLEKWIYIIMPTLMLMGILYGTNLISMIGWTSILFMFLTFISALQADYRKFVGVIKKPFMFLGLLLVFHLIVPIVVSLTADFLFGAQPEVSVGIVIVSLLPMGVTSIFWIAYNKGDLETALAYVTINTLLSPFIVPLTFSWLLGSQIALDAGSLITRLLELVLVPTILGIVVGAWVRRCAQNKLLFSGMSLLGKICLYCIVLANAAAISIQLHAVKQIILPVAATVLGVMLLGYAGSYWYGRICKVSNETAIAITYTGGVRNYTVGVVIAAAFFPVLTNIPVLLAMMLQHPLALMVYYVLTRIKKRKPPVHPSSAYSLHSKNSAEKAAN